MLIDPNTTLDTIENQLTMENQDKPILTSIFQKAVDDLDQFVEKITLNNDQWNRVILARGKIDLIIKELGDKVPADVPAKRDHLVMTLVEQSLGTLNTLLPELQVMITEFLDPQDVARLRLVSSSTKNVMDDPRIQKYFLEKAIGGTYLYREMCEDPDLDWEKAYKIYSPLKGVSFQNFSDYIDLEKALNSIELQSGLERGLRYEEAMEKREGILELSKKKFKEVMEIDRRIEEVKPQVQNELDEMMKFLPYFIFPHRVFMAALEKRTECLEIDKVEELIGNDPVSEWGPVKCYQDTRGRRVVFFVLESTNGDKTLIKLFQETESSAWGISGFNFNDHQLNRDGEVSISPYLGNKQYFLISMQIIRRGQKERILPPFLSTQQYWIAGLASRLSAT